MRALKRHNLPVLSFQSRNTSSKALTHLPVSFFFKKFLRGGVICGKFVRCKVKGSDGPHAVPYGRDKIQEKFKKIIPLWGPASCGNRSREVNSHSLLFGGSPFPTPHFTYANFLSGNSFIEKYKIFRDNPLFCPCKCPMASEGSIKPSPTAPILSSSKN